MLQDTSYGKIILLNGASSSGKSTFARALQTALPHPFLHFSIDHLNESKVLPLDRIRAGEFSWNEMRESYFEGFHRCIPALAFAGNNLIIEHIVETQVWMERLLAYLEPFDVFFVGIHCPLEELERRECARGDRRIGDARMDFETTHKLCQYDFEIDSTHELAYNVESVIQAWIARTVPSAFQRMRSC